MQGEPHMSGTAASLAPFFRIAAVAVGLAVLAVLAVAVPGAAWNPAALVAAAVLGVGGPAVALLPPPRPRQGAGDASAIWLIGPTGGLLLAWVVLAGAAVACGLAGLQAVAWALICVCVGGFIAGHALLHAATRIVETAAAQVVPAALDARTQWAAQIRQHAAQSEDEAVRRLLDALLQRIRYAANDRPTQPAPENADIQVMLAGLAGAVQSAEQLRPVLRQAEGLLEQREHRLRAGRSHA